MDIVGTENVSTIFFVCFSFLFLSFYSYLCIVRGSGVEPRSHGLKRNSVQIRNSTCCCKFLPHRAQGLCCDDITLRERGKKALFATDLFRDWEGVLRNESEDLPLHFLFNNSQVIEL